MIFNLIFEIKKKQSMKRKLNEEEIEFILQDFFYFFPNYVDKEIKKYTLFRMLEKMKIELSKIELHEKMIPLFKKRFDKMLVQSIIPYGESVGVITAQSLGEKQTQLTLNSFHQAGLSLATVVTGVPRFLEILNTSKEPKNPQNFFYVKKANDFHTIKSIVENSLKCIRFKDLIQSKKIYLQYQNNFWYDCFFHCFPCKEIPKDTIDICFKLNQEVLFRNKICFLSIKKIIEKEFEDITVIFSPLYIGQINLIMDYQAFFNTIPENDLYIKNNLEAFVNMFYEDVLQNKLEDLTISGVSKIKEYYINKSPNDNYYISTDGSNMKELLKLQYIDKKTLKSNDLWDIFNIIGIEGVRKFLIEELTNIVSSDGGFINQCHITLLVDTMTYTGNIVSISRYGIKKDKGSVLARSSFEESLDHFVKAGLFSEKENVSSVSASIMCGKHCSIGTGLPKIIPNLSKLLTKNDENLVEGVIQ